MDLLRSSWLPSTNNHSPPSTITTRRVFLLHEHPPKSYAYLGSYQTKVPDEEPIKHFEQTALAYIKSHSNFRRLKSFEMAKPQIYLSPLIRGEQTWENLDNSIKLGFMEPEADLFTLLLEGSTLEETTDGVLVIIFRTSHFNFVVFEQTSGSSYDYFGSGSVVGFPEDSAQTIYDAARSLITRRLDAENSSTIATVKNLSLYEVLRIENVPLHEVPRIGNIPLYKVINYVWEDGYKKALEKGQLEPDLLLSSSSVIRGAEDKLGEIETSNLIFVFTTMRKYQLRIPYALFNRQSDSYRFVDQNHVDASSEDTVGLLHDTVHTHIECMPPYDKETGYHIVVYEPKEVFRSAYNKQPNELRNLKLENRFLSGGNCSVLLPRNKLSDWRVGQTLIIVFGIPVRPVAN